VFARWEKAKAVEFLDIDGTRWYFDRAADNLFRINPEAKALKTQSHPDAADPLPYRWEDIRSVISTIECLPRYALRHGHGDCGIETMAFMTLCRSHGIPAHWESGWVTRPEENMHDWTPFRAFRPYRYYCIWISAIARGGTKTSR
jgi:hypothetical protein